MLPRALVHDCFTQDPADRSGGEEGCAKRFVGCEGIGNFEDAGFGALAIRFRSFVFLYALVQLPGGTIRLARPRPEFQTYQQSRGLPEANPAHPANGYQRRLGHSAFVFCRVFGAMTYRREIFALLHFGASGEQ